MRREIAIFLILIAIAVVIACCGCIRKPQGGGIAATKIKIGVMPDEATLPYYVAAQEGIFTNHGLDVEIIPFLSAMERDSALIAGEIDGAENDPVGVALMRNAGYDLKIVSIELQETPAKMRFAILASPASNISSVADLNGKKIAISRNTIIEYITDALVGDTAVEKVEVKKVPLRMQMLLSNEIDAATLPEPLASYALYKGARLVISDSMLNRTISQTVIVFRADFLNNNSEAVNEFLAAYGEAVKRINANPEKYRALLVEKTHIPPEIASNYTIATYLQPQVYPETDFDTVIHWLRAKNLLHRTISYE
ncbi:MAG: ABC transporter substrate-binding protein, partial [Methanophagales archaeon]|nr:ABC transporter substrate-binding protein [Methanophagales archaeon]